MSLTWENKIPSSLFSVFKVLAQTKCRPTIKPGYRHGFKEDEEEEAHPAGWVVVEELKHIEAPLGDFRETETLWTKCTPAAESLKKENSKNIPLYWPHLRDVWEAYDEGDEADDEDEDLLPLPQLHGILVHEGGDEALHRAELRQRTKQRQAAAAESVLISHHVVSGTIKSLQHKWGLFLYLKKYIKSSGFALISALTKVAGHQIKMWTAPDCPGPASSAWRRTGWPTVRTWAAGWRPAGKPRTPTLDLNDTQKSMTSKKMMENLSLSLSWFNIQIIQNMQS